MCRSAMGLRGEFCGAAAVPNVGNILSAAGSDQERRIAPCAIQEVNACLPPRERRAPLPGMENVMRSNLAHGFICEKLVYVQTEPK